MYARLGFRAPFVFAIAFAVVDLAGRLLVIERKDALEWGHDPWLTISRQARGDDVQSAGKLPFAVMHCIGNKNLKKLYQASTRRLQRYQLKMQSLCMHELEDLRSAMNARSGNSF